MEKIKVFIADDSVIVRERFIEMLSGINTIEVVGQSDNGKEALKSILKLHPDVVLLDVDIPGINGIEVMRKIKAAYPDIKVILFTSYSESDLKDECLKQGANFFFQPENIYSLIDFFESMKRLTNNFRNENILRQEMQ